MLQGVADIHAGEESRLPVLLDNSVPLVFFSPFFTYFIFFQSFVPSN
jgi:hypothetical protein